MFGRSYVNTTLTVLEVSVHCNARQLLLLCWKKSISSMDKIFPPCLFTFSFWFLNASFRLPVRNSWQRFLLWKWQGQENGHDFFAELFILKTLRALKGILCSKVFIGLANFSSWSKDLENRERKIFAFLRHIYVWAIFLLLHYSTVLKSDSLKIKDTR